MELQQHQKHLKGQPGSAGSQRFLSPQHATSKQINFHHSDQHNSMIFDDNYQSDTKQPFKRLQNHRKVSPPSSLNKTGYLDQSKGESESSHNNTAQPQYPNNILLQNFVPIQMTLNSRQTITVQLLGDKEKYNHARQEGNLDLLIDLIQSDELVAGGGDKQQQMYSKMAQRKSQVSQYTIAGNNNNELKSDLNPSWLINQEYLISHCALNQITYLLQQKRRELRLHIYYNSEQRMDICGELISMRRYIFTQFDAHKTIERRTQKYLLMSDDTGMQATLSLLLRLSDDELKGIKTSLDAANRALSLQQAGENSNYLKFAQPENPSNMNTPKVSIDFLQTNNTQAPSLDGGEPKSNQSPTAAQDYLEKRTNQSIISSKRAAILPKKISSTQNLDLKTIEKDFKSGWFKKNSNFLIDTIDNLLSDQSFSYTTIRMALIFLANLNNLCKGQGGVKVYLKKKQTIEKLEFFFDFMQPETEEHKFTEEEIEEVGNSLRSMLPQKEADYLILNAMRRVEELNPITPQTVYTNQQIVSEKETNAFSHFTANFHGEDVIRNMGNTDNDSAKYRLLSNQRDRVSSGDPLTSPTLQQKIEEENQPEIKKYRSRLIRSDSNDSMFEFLNIQQLEEQQLLESQDGLSDAFHPKLSNPRNLNRQLRSIGGANADLILKSKRDMFMGDPRNGSTLSNVNNKQQSFFNLLSKKNANRDIKQTKQTRLSSQLSENAAYYYRQNSQVGSPKNTNQELSFLEQQNYGELPFTAERSFVILQQEIDVIDGTRSDKKQGPLYDSNMKIKVVSPNRISNSSSKNQLYIHDVDRVTMRETQKKKHQYPQQNTMLKSSQFQTRISESHDDQPLIEYKKGGTQAVFVNQKTLDYDRLPTSNPEDLQSYDRQNSKQKKRVMEESSGSSCFACCISSTPSSRQSGDPREQKKSTQNSSQSSKKQMGQKINPSVKIDQQQQQNSNRSSNNSSRVSIRKDQQNNNSKSDLRDSMVCVHFMEQGKQTGVCQECQVQMREAKEKMKDCSIF